MSSLRPGILLLMFLIGVRSLPAAEDGRWQGTASDYERSNELKNITKNKVFKTVNPHWLEDNTHLWYKNELTRDHWEYILADAAQGRRERAFDHERLAAALSQATKREIHAERLPIERLSFKDDRLLIFAAGKSWNCDLQTYELHEDVGTIAYTSRPPQPPPGEQPRTSRSGSETYILFINHTRQVLALTWMDPDGGHLFRGAVFPGIPFVRRTFDGHVWHVTDADNNSYGYLEATEHYSVAIIEDRQEKPAKRSSRIEAEQKKTEWKELSPDKHWATFIKDYNLWMRDNKTNEAVALSRDGNASDSYAAGVCWAPDSRHFVAMKTKAGDDHRIFLVESAPKDQLQPKLHTLPYLKPGDRIPITKPHLFDVLEHKEIAISDELFPNPWDISEVRWEHDSDKFTFLYNQRGHQVLRVITVDARSGDAQALIDEQSKTFVDYAFKKFTWYLDKTHETIWMSERDGWNHLYLYDTKCGKVKNQITRGPWVVRGVDRVDPEKRQIWFRAGGIYPDQDPYYVHYCRVNFDGSDLVMLTQGDGTHSLSWSGDKQFYVDTYSRVDLPPVSELHRAKDGQMVCYLERADASELLATGWQPPERFAAKGRDGTTDIYGVLVRPMNFDPTRKYPVIEKIYAGPTSSFVPKAWSSYYDMQDMAELGFVVVMIDGMGTSNRSKAFHDVCWKNLGDAGFPDRILWMEAAAKKFPCLDLSRVGIYGGSAGGQNALRALLAFGDFYKAGVADCGCHDNRMDKIWWNELWMGWPIGPEYAEQSNVTNAHKLKGKLFLMVGELDKNVDPSSTMQVVDALVKANKDFDYLVIPGAGHGSAESPYGRRRRMDFFVRNLLNAEPRGTR